MFTGFASENTPAIQVWDFATAERSLVSISLTDDCAPIQVIVSGASSNTIILYLPSAPIEGKQIKLVNTFYGNFPASISIRSSDASGLGASTTVGFLTAGQTLDLCYSKNFISRSASSIKTGWISLNQGFISASNRNAVSFGDGNIASWVNTSTIGGAGNIANNTNAAVVGGSSNIASNTSSAVVGGSSNTASGESGFIGGGTSNSLSGTNSSVVGGTLNNASASNTFIGGGSTNSATSTTSSVIGGANNVASGNNSAVFGGRRGFTRSIQGNFVASASIIPISDVSGAQQTALLVLGRETTNATATVLTSNPSAAGTTNQVILPNNSAYTFQGTVIANVTGGGNTSSWKFEGAIKRGANAASTTLVAAVTPTVIAQDVGAVTWVLAITADTTNGGIKVEVTGAAATTIRWVCKIETTEVTF